MLKKIVAACAILLTSSNIVFADVIAPYLAVDVSGTKEKWKIKDVTTTQARVNGNGIAGDVAAGLGWTLTPHFYLGAEIFGGESSTQSHSVNINTDMGPALAKLRMKYSYGASILPGYKFTDTTMLFLRAGALATRFDLHQTIVPVTATTRLSQNKVAGGQAGVGLQLNVGHWGVRGEYDYAAYRTFSAFNNKIKTRDNQIKIGFLYNIC